MLAWMESSKRNREIAAYIIAAVDGLPFGGRALKRPFMVARAASSVVFIGRKQQSKKCCRSCHNSLSEIEMPLYSRRKSVLFADNKHARHKPFRSLLCCGSGFLEVATQ